MPLKDKAKLRAYQKSWEDAKRKDPVWLAKRRAYWDATKEHRREVQKLYSLKNADKIAAYQEANKDHISEVHKKWYVNNHDKWRAWYDSNRVKLRSYYKKWAPEYYRKHPEKLWKNTNPEQYKISSKICQKRWIENNRDWVNERLRARKARIKSNPDARAFYRFVRSKKLIKCYYCGVQIPGKNAHVDHVIALAKDGNHASSNLCASCPSCNLKKQAMLPSEIKFLDQGILNL